MSERLAHALIRLADKAADERPSERAFLRMVGVPVEVASAIASAWTRDPEGFALRVIASPGLDMSGYTLAADETATSVRNAEQYPRGVLQVVCEGQRVPDGQGVKGLRRIDPSGLLESEPGFALLASIAPAVDIRAVREVGEALRELAVSDRPPALRVAGYLDAVAGGKSASEALPLLGAFADPQGSLSKPRLMDNIRLVGLSASRTVSADEKCGMLWWSSLTPTSSWCW
jgi:hypothetical protein